MIQVHFEKTGDKYIRNIKLPDETEIKTEGVKIPDEWHSPETYSWVKPLYKKSRDELIEFGLNISQALFGEEGINWINQHRDAFCKIIVLENQALPEISRIPWELAYVGDRFLSTDDYTPIVRRPASIRPKKEFTINKPLKMAFFSATPRDQNPLMVEDELLSTALALSEHMADNRIVVHEIINCTMDKIKEAFRFNEYDIIYFSGHGGLSDNEGYLALENPGGDTERISAGDFVSLLRRQRNTALVFLNCCESAVSDGGTHPGGWLGIYDVARRTLGAGVPEVIATQARIFDETGRKLMKSFFEEICLEPEFDVARALSIARNDVSSDSSQYHDFYHFIQLSAVDKDCRIKETDTGEKRTETNSGWRDRVVVHTENYMTISNNFVGRFSYITQIEDAWRKDSVRVVGIHGFGGVGKTFLCNRIEERTLSHHIESKKFNRSIWIDFREDKGDSLSGFLGQLIAAAHDLGYPAYGKVIDDQDRYPTPMEKFRPLSKHLEKNSGGKVLLILDNLEAVVDADGKFHDPELGKWFRELIVRLPVDGRVLVTCRYRFDFFPEGRRLTKTKWVHLTELGFTERVCLMNQWPELRRMPDTQKAETIKAAGGHPFFINLVAEYLEKNLPLPNALRTASRETAIYARLDWFLEQLDQDTRDWLTFIAAFPQPKIKEGIISARSIRDKTEDTKRTAAEFDAAVAQLIKYSLIHNTEKGLHVPALVSYQLFHTPESQYFVSEKEQERIHWAIATFFLFIAGETEQKSSKAHMLRQGIEPMLSQKDTDLLKIYLSKCADTFHGHVPAAVFLDVVNRSKEPLLNLGDERSFHALGFCAQTLIEMRYFRAGKELLDQLLQSKKLPDKLKGNIYGTVGTIYLNQRNWEQALENYKNALEWYEKTENHVALGNTYHQIGRVYEEQRNWEQALENYKNALEWYEKTENHVALGNTYHQIGRVYEEQRNWEQALENYKNALEWKEKTENHVALGNTYHQIGMVYEEQRNWEQALENYKNALEWKEKTENHFALGSTYHQIGMVYQLQRNWEQALENYKNALEWNEKTENHFELGDTYHQIGRVYEEQAIFLDAAKAFVSGFIISFKTDNERSGAANLKGLKRILDGAPETLRDKIKQLLPDELHEMLIKNE